VTSDIHRDLSLLSQWQPCNVILASLCLGVNHSAITHSENSIYLTAAYFVPDDQMLHALTEAAARGIDEKIVLPGFSDSALVFYAS
jgi:phosphatidylserine/phosphatidylglycerophosphate/cardiolipin synthase-like enzyme